MDSNKKIEQATECLEKINAKLGELEEMQLSDSELEGVAGGRGGFKEAVLTSSSNRKTDIAGRRSLKELLIKLGGKGFRNIDSSVV